MKQHRPYQLAEYDPTWPQQFEVKKKLILEVLGQNVLDIYHIGSTSIPGMIAKPQIDIMVVVSDLQLVQDKTAEMTKHGFTPRGNYTGIGEEYFTEDDKNQQRLSSIHVLPVGHPQIDEILIFRNHLLNNKEDRELYISVKRDLYKKYADNYHEYDIGKKNIITEIKNRAHGK